MIMQIIRVHMGGNQHLKALAPNFAGQRHADLMALLRGDLALTEALVGVERHHAYQSAPAPPAYLPTRGPPCNECR